MLIRECSQSERHSHKSGESVENTVAGALALGYVADWENCPWNAEMSLEAEDCNPPKTDCTPWHWLVPVRKA